MTTKNELMNKTNAELRQICANMGIVGMSKKRKDVIIDAILANEKANTEAKALKSDSATIAPKSAATVASTGPLVSMRNNFV